MADCTVARERLDKGLTNCSTCYGDSSKGSSCTTIGKYGTCSIKVCFNPVGSETVSMSCNEIANTAYSIITGKGFPGQHTAVLGDGSQNLLVSVERSTNSKGTRTQELMTAQSPHPHAFWAGDNLERADLIIAAVCLQGRL